LQPIAEAWRARVQDPEFQRSLALLVAKLESAQEFADGLPERITRSLRDSGRIVHPSLTLHEVARIVQTHEEHGTDSAVSVVDAVHEELLGRPDFRDELANRWSQSRRWPILAQVLEAHDRHLYLVSVPAALALAEGVVVDCVGHVGRLGGTKLKEYIRGMTKTDELLGPTAAEFGAGLIGSHFAHGAPPPPFSRHAILHGGDVAYGTRQNSVLAIVWVDYLMHLYQEAVCPSPGSAGGVALPASR
jgi:hypothetical protein